eukprot:scaffold1194_cov127-Cylindrotheca_fusiformis.AAC.35
MVNSGGRNITTDFYGGERDCMTRERQKECRPNFYEISQQISSTASRLFFHPSPILQPLPRTTTMLGHGRINFETPNVIDEGDAVPETPARSLESDFAHRGSVGRVSISDEDRVIFKPSLSRSIKINYEDDADDEPTTELLTPVNLDPEYGDDYGETKEEIHGNPSMEQTRLFAAAMLSESDRRGGSRMFGKMKSPVKNLFGGGKRKQREDHFIRDGLGLDYPPSVMDKWRNDRRRRCRYALIIVSVAVVLFTIFGVFMKKHGDDNSSRMTETFDFLTVNNISTEEAIADRQSPQFKAAQWIANEDAERLEVPASTDDPNRFIQRYTAAVLYYGLGGEDWGSQLKFLSNDHECSWNNEMPDEKNELYAVGLSCDPNLHIDSILIPSNNLQGTIPEEIRFLKELKFISMKHNNIYGEIPSGLKELRLLEYLDLKYNQMQGTFPDFVGELAHLQVIGLSRNNFVGKLPPSLGTLRLKTLAVDDNALTGDLSAIRLMSPLQYLYAQNNSFSGNLFHGILMSQLPNLVEVDLSDNDLTGSTIPSHIFTLPKLRLFDASGNNITGTLPADIAENNVLEYLSFRGNSIGSSLPAKISNLKKLSHLDLEDNSLMGALPFSMGYMSSLQFLYLGKNSLTNGAIPGELKELTALKELSLNNLGLQNEIPSWIGGLTDLKLLDLRENELSGTLEEIDFSQMHRLAYLMLNDNKLSGTIPESMGLVTSLEVIALYHNSVSGSVDLVCDAVSNIAWVGTDCEPDITCYCCEECCIGEDCYDDVTWDTLESSRWDHTYSRAEYAFDPNILSDAVQPSQGSV